jgi:hypothetical protein
MLMGLLYPKPKEIPYKNTDLSLNIKEKFVLYKIKKNRKLLKNSCKSGDNYHHFENIFKK